MKNNLVLSTIAVISILACKSVKNTTESQQTPAKATELVCDEKIIDLRADITPIINEHCVSCHSKGSNLGGYDFTIAANIERAAMNGELLGTIKWKTGYKPMPEGAPQLNVSTINKIECWIKKEKEK